jgi:Helix-turn-helix family
VDPSPARALWQCIEPYHAVIYFTTDAHTAFEEIGLRGFWRGYFAGRAAPLGAVGAGAVVATFYGFHPDFVARAVPGVWSVVSPEAAIGAREQGAERALVRLFDEDGSAIARAAGLVRQATDGCDPFARPLFAANADLAWPREPHVALWHGCTLLREHRGDGHVAALYAADVDPCEAHVLRLAVSGVGRESIAPYRGWDDDDWAAAADRLVERGWLNGERAATPVGVEAHAAIEADTDRMAEGPTRALGEDGLVELLGIMRPMAAALAASGTIPFPNPIGVPRPSTD